MGYSIFFFFFFCTQVRYKSCTINYIYFTLQSAKAILIYNQQLNDSHVVDIHCAWLIFILHQRKSSHYTIYFHFSSSKYLTAKVIITQKYSLACGEVKVMMTTIAIFKFLKGVEKFKIRNQQSTKKWVHYNYYFYWQNCICRCTYTQSIKQITVTLTQLRYHVSCACYHANH